MKEMEYFNKLLIENAALRADKSMYQDYAHDLAQKLRALRHESAKNQKEQTELLKLRAENKKLKQSLRKLYEKYIKPTQGMKLGTQGKVMSERDKWRKLALRPFNNGK